ncbi:MAG: hypothetical protein UY21_C0001G0054 [Microgenomates group bacterium GW2011_GWA1_48_10]|nr:MAG: hypothetical protein UY21_C0001G0054 [Microgenomates group bacterium GW2011_GWA1_48_10]
MRLKLLLISIVLLAAILRLYRLANAPPSLYWDEASIGYNAYSIAQTLRDEHGEFLPLTRFIAFGDYKPPGYIYAAALSVKLFGPTEFVVRLPSAAAGTLLVLVSFYLARMLTGNAKLGLVTAALLAVSPWALQFSRGAFEANLATLFSSAGLYFFVRTIRTKTLASGISSAVFFALSLYTFNSHRVFVPAVIGALGLIYFREIWRSRGQWLVFLLALLLLLAPLIPHLLSREGQLRFYEVTWLNDLAPIELSNSRTAVDGNTWWSGLIHNRRIIFSQEFLKHYTDHFRAEFLFFSGDVNPRLSIQTVGEMYWLDLPLLLIGVFILVKKRRRAALVLLAWVVLSPVPAATARETPHALRILHILPSLQIVAAFGLLTFWKLDSFKKIRLLLVPIYGLFIIMYLHDYYVHYPKFYSSDWQYGYKEMVGFVSSLQDKYDHISVTDTLGRPYIYLLFYQKYPPEKYWANRQVRRDWYGFWYVDGFDKYTFGGPLPPGRSLIVSGPQPIPGNWQLLKSVTDPQGNTVFQISEKD